MSTVSRKKIKRQRPRVTTLKRHRSALVWEILLLLFLVASVVAIGYFGWR